MTIEPGETKKVELRVNNAYPYSALQGDIYLPDGLKIVGMNMDANLMSSNPAATYVERVDGSVRFISYSPDNSNFSSFNDVVLRITFEATTDLHTGDALVEMKNIRVATHDSSEYLASDVSTRLPIVQISIIDVEGE